jgi:hypothetical protein
VLDGLNVQPRLAHVGRKIVQGASFGHQAGGFGKPMTDRIVVSGLIDCRPGATLDKPSRAKVPYYRGRMIPRRRITNRSAMSQWEIRPP